MTPKRSHPDSQPARSGKKQLLDFQRYHGAPTPSGLGAIHEAEFLQQDSVKNEELLPEMNLYPKVEIATQILSEANRDIYPLGQIVHGTPIEFRHQAGNNQYVDLSASTLCVVVRIVKANGTPIDEDDPIAPVTNALHAMFQNIEVYLNTTKVTQPNNLYPYIAYLCQLTSFEPSVLET